MPLIFFAAALPRQAMPDFAQRLFRCGFICRLIFCRFALIYFIDAAMLPGDARRAAMPPAFVTLYNTEHSTLRDIFDFRRYAAATPVSIFFDFAY